MVYPSWRFRGYLRKLEEPDEFKRANEEYMKALQRRSLSSQHTNYREELAS